MILLGFILVSFFLQKKFNIKLFETKNQMFKYYLLMYAVSITWDTFAIWRGHWFYPGRGLLGIYIGLMPLEDYIFVFACSYFGLILYKAVSRF